MPVPATLPDDSVIFAVLRLCIEERGWDYIYAKPSVNDEVVNSTCVYIDDNKPSCLFGLFFSKLGYAPQQIAAYEGDGASSVFWNLVMGEVIDYPNMQEETERRNKWLTSPISMAISQIQTQQDGGQSWGRAFESGMEVYEHEKRIANG